MGFHSSPPHGIERHSPGTQLYGVVASRPLSNAFVLWHKHKITLEKSAYSRSIFICNTLHRLGQGSATKTTTMKHSEQTQRHQREKKIQSVCPRGTHSRIHNIRLFCHSLMSSSKHERVHSYDFGFALEKCSLPVRKSHSLSLLKGKMLIFH